MPIKTMSDQSQEFALCIFALASFILTLFDQRRLALATVCAALMFGFFVNTMFVAAHHRLRTALPALQEGQHLNRVGRPKLGIKVDATPHGFRSLFRDWAGDATAFPREIAEAALAHTVGADPSRF